VLGSGWFDKDYARGRGQSEQWYEKRRWSCVSDKREESLSGHQRGMLGHKRKRNVSPFKGPERKVEIKRKSCSWREFSIKRKSCSWREFSSILSQREYGVHTGIQPIDYMTQQP
jgi:hypothetical protein